MMFGNKKFPLKQLSELKESILYLKKTRYLATRMCVTGILFEIQSFDTNRNFSAALPDVITIYKHNCALKISLPSSSLKSQNLQ